MAELSKNAYLKQIALYLKNNDYQKSYDFGKEFVQKFPDEMMAHFLLAKAASMIERYEETMVEGRKAFNLAKSEEDMVSCAVLTSVAYFELKEYEKGQKFLSAMEKIKTNEDVEQLLLIFSIAIKDVNEALKHMTHLFELNERMTEELLARYF